MENESVSPKSRLGVLLFCLFLWPFGAHRFYVGKIGTGILTILTVGGFCGVWPLIDLILIIIGAFRDKEGRRVLKWFEPASP
ncbi:MAG: TM2 domain-containing protein [Candidatus Omnitrophica bacterium]|nr:TM2 domain-containing protein [Candidatus Omnitrophota bacterium]